MESASSDSDGKVKKNVPYIEYNGIICALIEYNIFVLFHHIFRFQHGYFGIEYR